MDRQRRGRHMPRSQLKTKPSETPSERTTLCQQVWGLDWNREFPVQLEGSLRIEYKTFHEAQPLLKKLLPEVYQVAPGTARFGETDTKGFKDKYFEAVGDF